MPDRQILVQYAVDFPRLPDRKDIVCWASAGLQESRQDVEVVVRIVDAAESEALNRQYRHKDGPTNVLSFPYDPIPGVGQAIRGDVVICAPVVEQEARSQGKTSDSHWAHIVIHGVLHLLGYDHQDDDQARIMEDHERRLLHGLGYADPY